MHVMTTERVPIKLWSPPIQHAPACDTWPGELRLDCELPDGLYCSCQREVIQQFKNLANHPLTFKHVAGMPDFHLGYGMPIGGVLATRGGVIPNAVGVDIGCGMIAMRTQWLAREFDSDRLQELRMAIHQRVPVGNAHHTNPVGLPDVRIGQSLPVVGKELLRAAYQMGTLGGGNHFIELQSDDGGGLWIMLHSGSRNIGYQVCQYYHKVAQQLMARYHSNIPDPDLAFLPEETIECGNYLAEMNWCMNFAEANRRAILAAVMEAFVAVIGVKPFCLKNDLVDTHHNFVAKENHFGQNVWVHRKGAVKATGLVTIPGSMGTASYIGRGLEPRESFNTCSHGAGRVMGRRVAKALITHDEAVAEMAHVVFGVREGAVDEMPRCYKDIEDVMAAQVDLVEPVFRLQPLAVVKG